jgi:DNA mismatch repair protein MutL
LAGRPDKTVQHFFVNGRPVKDRILMAALSQAYTGILERGRSAEAFLFVSLPYADVDVNVHPAKAEVRFKDTQLVFRLVLRAVAEGAASGHTIKEVLPAVGERGPSGRVAEEGVAWTSPRLGFEPVATAGLAPGIAARPGGGADWTAASGDSPTAKGPAVLGQYENMYIVAAGEDGLLVIDQHNAHERVLFEKYREIDREKIWPRKMLLLPPILELSPSAVVSLESNAALFEDLGFRVEAMGGRSFALKEYPDIFKPEQAVDIFLDLLEEAGQKTVEDRRAHMLATLACKTAVKAGEPLNREKMGYLVEELFKTSQPALCPHGRPVVVRVEKSVIDKGLGRKGQT